MAGKTFRMPTIPPKLKVETPKFFKSLGDDAEIGFQVHDATGLIGTLLSLPQVALDAAGYEMSKIANEVIDDAKENYVPVDTGNLKDSGDYDDYEPNRGQTLAQIGMWFGGDITREQALHGRNANARLYALDQHENMTYKHLIGGPKYLERPFQKKFPQIRDRLAGAIRAALGDNLLQYLTIGNAGLTASEVPHSSGPVGGKK